MGLSCECWDGDLGDYVWWYEDAGEFTTLETKRRRACISCESQIPVGSTVLPFITYRHPTLFELNRSIYSEEEAVPKGKKYLCEACGDLFLSLSDLGFCVNPGESMAQLLHDYHENYGRMI